MSATLITYCMFSNVSLMGSSLSGTLQTPWRLLLITWTNPKAKDGLIFWVVLRQMKVGQWSRKGGRRHESQVASGWACGRLVTPNVQKEYSRVMCVCLCCWREHCVWCCAVAFLSECDACLIEHFHHKQDKQHGLKLTSYKKPLTPPGSMLVGRKPVRSPSILTLSCLSEPGQHGLGLHFLIPTGLANTLIFTGQQRNWNLLVFLQQNQFISDN